MTQNGLPEAVVYIATSLDGYIARRDNGLDWLLSRGGDEDYGYADFMRTIDVLVMGRGTYETVRGFGEWPYDKKVFVLSTHPVAIPAELTDRVEALSMEPREVLARLGEAGVRRVYVDGGKTIQRFLRDGLIAEMTISVAPVLIGSGIPLFGELSGDVDLELREVRGFQSGFVQSRYAVRPAIGEGRT